MRSCWAIFLPLLLAYADTLGWIWDRWMQGDSYYTHGPLVLLGAIFITYNRRQQLRDVESIVDPRGWWLLGFGLLLRLIGAAQMVDSLSASSLLVSITGAIWLCLGWKQFRLFIPTIILLGFATPLPLDITGRIAFELKEVAVDWAVALGNAMGLGATRIGSDMRVPGQETPLYVADACSGLRSLLALTTLGYCLAFFLGSANWLRRVVLLVAAMPLAVITNVIRIVGLCFMAKIWGVPFAGNTGHDIMNWAAWLINVTLLLVVDMILHAMIGREKAS